MPTLDTGVTDARFFVQLGIQTYGFLPMPTPPGFDRAPLVHGADEHIPLETLEREPSSSTPPCRRCSRRRPLPSARAAPFEHRRLGVAPEDLLQRVDDLALADVDAHSISGSIRLRSPAAASFSSPSFASTSPPSRRPRAPLRRSTCLRSSAGSIRRRSVSSSLGSRQRLTPAMIRSPESTSRWKRYEASAISRCGKFCLTASTGPRLRRSSRRIWSAASSIRSVSASTKYEPPSGSIVLVTPVSCWMICCVRTAILTASWVGSASASS